MPQPPLEELETELKRDPGSRRFYELAREYQKLGRLDRARDLCEKGLALHPSQWQARILLAQIYVSEGRLDEGRQMAEKVLLALHDSVPANHLAADIYWALGQRDKALRHYQIVDLLEPGRAGVRDRLAELRPAPAPLASGASPEAGPTEAEGLEAPSGTSASPPPAPAGDPEAQGASDAAEPVKAALSTPAPEPPLSVSEVNEPGPMPDVKWQAGEEAAEVLGDDTASFAEILESEGSEPPSAEPASAPAEELPPPATPPRGWATSAGQAEEGLSDSDEEPGEAAAAPGLNTFTLAELYEHQGYPEKAVEIYQRMLLQDPDNGQIRVRIHALMQRIAGEAPEAPVVHQEDVEKAMRQKRIAVLQGWLRRVREGRHV